MNNQNATGVRTNKLPIGKSAAETYASRPKRGTVAQKKRPGTTAVPTQTLLNVRKKQFAPELTATPRSACASASLKAELKNKLDSVGCNFAEGCIDGAVQYAYEEILAKAPQKKDQFVDTVARSIVSVTGRKTALPGAMEYLAFKLAFSLDCGSLLSNVGAKVESVDDGKWARFVENRLGASAGPTMAAASGMADVMVCDSSQGQVVFDASRYMAKKLFSKIVPKTPRQGVRYDQMALALRNFSVKQIDVYGPLSSKLEAALVKKAKDLLKETKITGQADPVRWTVELLHVAASYRDDHYR